MLSALTMIIITEELTLRKKLGVFSGLALYKYVDSGISMTDLLLLL